MAKSAPRFTHLALPVSDLERSTEFYQRLTSMEVTNGVKDQVGSRMAGLTDSDGSFVLVLIETSSVQPLSGIAHMGVSCDSTEEVTRLAEEAKGVGHQVIGPAERPAPLGYSAFVTDPDGHQVEIYHGQHAGIMGV
jgi:catechol 2,3-dioxygenase-like lactoylglutathione lyase family enzyme